jgi:hypothetical protein
MNAFRPAVLTVLLLSSLASAQGASSTEKKATRSSRPQAAQGASTGAAGSFSPTCQTPNFPQPAPQKRPEIDSQCGLTGSGTGAEGVQDSVKNNFCATGTPREVTIAELKQLQAQVEKNPAINFGDRDSPGRKKGPTTDRKLLQALGEGTPVVLKAYVLIARQEGPESVNCGKNVPNQVPFHDIHISLVDSKEATKDDECSSVVAEMSPHRRPDAWTHGNVEKVAQAKVLARVTGQLFFDSSHVPCANGQPVGTNPKRTSLWELHPIYKFEVCTADCEGAGQWVPLDQWVQR